MTRDDALDAVLMTVGRVSFVAVWFVAILLVYRGLGSGADGLAQAGVFALAIACVKVASGCISDPVDLAVMRRVPPLLRDDPARAFGVLRAAIGLRVGVALAVAGALALFAPLLATHVLGRPDTAPLVRLVAAAIVADILFRAVLVVLHAAERFRAFLMLEAMVHLGRFAAILALWAAGMMRVDLVLASYAAAPFAVALAGLSLLLPRGLFASPRVHRADLLDLVGFLKWMMPAMMLAAVNERLDVFLVFSFRGAGDAGLYGAVVTLALVPDILAGCLSTLLQPRIVRMHAGGAFARSMLRFLAVSLPVCGLGFLTALLLAEPLLPLLIGARYLPAIPAFLWLLAGTVFWLAVTPLPMTLVAIMAPGRIVLVTIGQSVLVLLGGLVLLPAFGLVGMAAGVFVTRVAVALALVGVARSMVTAPAGCTALDGGAARP